MIDCFQKLRGKNSKGEKIFHENSAHLPSKTTIKKIESNRIESTTDYYL